MKNYEPRLYDVKVSQLQRLDLLAGDSAKLDAALGSRLDAQGPEDRFINAARALFGKEVDDTIDIMITEGQPGYAYKIMRLRLIALLQKPAASSPPLPHLDDADAPTIGGTGVPAQQRP